MPDDIDIGIGVHDNGGAAVVEAMNKLLAEYRKNLQQTVQDSANFNTSVGRYQSRLTGQFQSAMAAQREATTSIAGSIDVIGGKIDSVVSRFVSMGQAIDVTNREAVAAFRNETNALTEYLDQIGATDIALDRLGATLADLSTRQRNLPSPAAPAVSPGVGLTGASGAAAEADTAVQKLSTDINVAIGEYIRLGQIIDTTSLAAVTEYRAQGDALSANLASLGATEAELNRIGSASARAEQAFGAYTAEVNNNTVAVNTIPIAARRGANAVATLAFGLAAGGTSARTMAIGLGSAISAMAQFSDNAAIAASASGIGAVITVLAVVIGLFYDLNHEVEKTSNALEGLDKLNAKQIGTLLKVANANANAAMQASAAAADLAASEAESWDVSTRIQGIALMVQAHQLQKHYEDLIKIRETLTKAMIEETEKEQKALEEEGRKAQEKADQDTAERLRGPTAARKLAADQELADQLRKLDKETGFQVDKDKAAEGYRRQHTERLLELDREEAERRHDLFEKLQLERLNAEAKLESDVFQVQRGAADRRYQQSLEEIRKNRDLGSANSATRRQAENLAEQAHTADLEGIEKDRAEKIADIRDQTQGQLDVFAEVGVNEAKIRENYKKQLDILQSAIDSTSVAPAVKKAAEEGKKLIEALIPEEIAKSRLDQIDKDVQANLSQQESVINRTNELLAAHAINTLQARKQILAATVQERDTVAASIPELQKQADAMPGNSQALARVEAMREKLLQLNISVMQLSDQFYQLKETGFGAAQDALEKFVQSIPGGLFGQQHGEAVANIDNLKTHLREAQDELNALMAGPHTNATNQRVSQLRDEIQGVNNQLDESKRALTTWRTLFLGAARSIVQALFDVQTHMLAVYLIQKAMGFFGFGFSGGSDAGSLVGTALGGVNVAGGGLIRGPGSSTSDSIPANLSNGEFVVRAAAVRALGTEFLSAINRVGTGNTMKSRRTGFAEGGFVLPGGSGGVSGGFDATIGLDSGLVVQHLKSREGTKALLEVVAGNRRAFKAIMGR